MGELLAMSGKELTRLETVQVVLDRRMYQREAASRLGLSVRQVKRLVSAYRREGAAGLISQRRGRPSNHRIPDAEKAYFLALVRKHCEDFRPTLAAEYLAHEGFHRSVETLRSWMIEGGVWEAKRARRRRPHPPRERRPRLGELIQIDGSPHDWFEGRAPRCCLIAFIDDATSRVLQARFVPVEWTRAYLEVLRDHVLMHGVPGACYSDRHSIFTKHDPEDPAPTQLERAMLELGIEPIQARSPQAKGRIERLFETLQDRLVKAMRLAGISDLDAANAFLQHYLEEHNQRFAAPARQPGDAHQAWRRQHATLNRICAVHHARKISKDLVISFRNQHYLILMRSKQRYSTLRGSRATVCEHLDGTIELLHREKPLSYRLIDSGRRRSPPADEKNLNARVDELLGPDPPRIRRHPTTPGATAFARKRPHRRTAGRKEASQYSAGAKRQSARARAPE